MDSFIEYFTTISTTHRSFLLVGGLTFFWLMESAIPLFEFGYNKWLHARLNLLLTFTTILVNLAGAFVLVKSSDYVVSARIGILHFGEMPIWIYTLLGLLLLDLIGAWFIHWLGHKVTWLWRFHVVHHTDQHIDTTSANRHHPGESILRLIFTTIAVILIGAPMWMVFLYQSLSLVMTQFNHSNIKMNPMLDRTLGLVFCTPNIHRVHHHYKQPYTDSNYGNIFSFWDRLFGTYMMVDNSKLVYGIDTHMDPSEVQNIGSMIKLPFQPYRPSILYNQDEKL